MAAPIKANPVADNKMYRPPQQEESQPSFSEIEKLDCGALVNYWEGQSGETVYGAHQKVLKLTNETLVSSRSGKLICEADLITDMFLGQRAQLIAELVEDEVWHSFSGFHTGLYITKK